MNLAIILFSTGHLREAFQKHEWRFKCDPHFKERQLDASRFGTAKPLPEGCAPHPR